MATSKTFYKLQKGRKHFKTVAEAKKYAKENNKSGNILKVTIGYGKISEVVSHT
jgi:hypothetical protein